MFRLVLLLSLVSFLAICAACFIPQAAQSPASPFPPELLPGGWLHANYCYDMYYAVDDEQYCLADVHTPTIQRGWLYGGHEKIDRSYFLLNHIQAGMLDLWLGLPSRIERKAGRTTLYWDAYHALATLRRRKGASVNLNWMQDDYLIAFYPN